MTFLHKLAQRLARMKAPILMGVLLTSACEQIPAAGPAGTGTQEPVVVASVASVSVSPGAVSATTGQSVQLTAIPRDVNGTPLLGRTVTWRSSNAAVVTVNANGIATGVPAGSATITATSEGKSGSAAITVTQTPVPVASVTLTPAITNVTAGYTVQLIPTLQDASGNVLLGRVVTWVSSNPAAAAVIGGGLVSGVAAGSATITATSETRNGTSAVTVAVPPPPGSWPNEPAGMTLLSDLDFSGVIPTGPNQAMSGGWNISNPSGSASRVSDATAPFSAPYVLQMRYPVGFAGGSAPATAYYNFPAGHGTEVYVSFWWKASTPWQGHSSNVNKLLFIYTDAANPRNALIPEMYGPPGGPYVLRTALFELGPTEPRNWADANVSDGTLVPGTWYRIEVYAKHSTSTTSYDGILKQWVNGVLVTSYTDINYALTPFNVVEVSPTWGGAGDVKTETDFFQYDQIHISGR